MTRDLPRSGSPSGASPMDESVEEARRGGVLGEEVPPLVQTEVRGDAERAALVGCNEAR